MTAETIEPEWRFQSLIVDEGQDFDAEWFDILRLFEADDADMLWLDDQDQAIRVGLGDRTELERRIVFTGFIGYRTRDNLRRRSRAISRTACLGSSSRQEIRSPDSAWARAASQLQISRPNGSAPS